MTSWELILCLGLILCSAILSASEVALFSLSRFQLRTLKEHFRPIYRKIKRLIQDPGGLLVSILVLNEIFNIALSSIITKAVSQQKLEVPTRWSHFYPNLPHWMLHMALGVAITTPIILFLCEVTPKVIGSRLNQLIAPATGSLLSLIYDFFKPLRLTIGAFMRLITQVISRKTIGNGTLSADEHASEEAILKESDFLLMVEEGHREGAIQESELELIRNVFDLDNTNVGEIATPLSQVLSLPESTSVKEALLAMKGKKYSRIPVTQNNKKNVIGILYSKDLLRAKLQPELLEFPIESFVKRPLFVSPTMRLNALFRRFKQQKTHMAIVKSSTNEVMGVVTMSDILDTLFEDYFSETESGATGS